MTDPAALIPDVDALVDTIEVALANLAMSGPVTESEYVVEARIALSDLAATARWKLSPQYLEALHRAEAAEADRDRALADRFSLAKRYTDENDRLARRVAELEAALREAAMLSTHPTLGDDA